MVVTATLPNGTELDFPDGTSDEMIQSGIQKMAAQGLISTNATNAASQAAPQQNNPGSFTDQLEQGLAVGGRNVAAAMAGIGDIPAMIVNAGNIGIPNAEKYQVPLPSQAVANAIDTATNGYTTPRNNLEKITSAAEEFMGSGLTGAGLAKVAGEVPGAVNSVSELFSKLSPTTTKDLVGLGLAGAGGEIGHDLAPNGVNIPYVGNVDVGRLIGTLGGALMPEIATSPTALSPKIFAETLQSPGARPFEHH